MRYTHNSAYAEIVRLIPVVGRNGHRSEHKEYVFVKTKEGDNSSRIPSHQFQKEHSMNSKNARLTVRNSNDRKGFNIFIELNGKEHFIMFHRKNPWLRKRIDNKRLDDIRRESYNKKLIPESLRHRRRTTVSKLSSSLELL